MITLKRAYDPVSRTDGTRFFVERLWPRGLSKARLHVDAWLKEVAPSTELRKWFNHDPDKWGEFRKRYVRELDSRPEAWQPVLSAAPTRDRHTGLQFARRRTQPILGPDGKPRRVPRSKNWTIRVYDANGHAKDISTGSPLITKAKQILHDLESAKGKGEPIGAQVGKITFDDAVKAVIADHTMKGCRSTEREQGRIDKHLTPYFGGWRMVKITSDTITAYVVARKAAGAKGATINRELQILKRAFRLAQRAGKLLSAPYIPKLEESEARQGFFERPEFEAVRDKLPAYLRPLLTFYYFTGWRSREVLSLERRQVNLAAGIVSLDPSQSKNKHGRQFDFGALDELRDVLTEQEASADRLTRKRRKMVTTVFHGPDGSPIKDSEFRKAWVAAREAAGYPTKLVHDFRRTAARNLVRAGVPETVAMKLTGHKTRSMFDRYNITSGDDLRTAGELLQAYATAKPKAAQKKQAQVRLFKRRAGGR